MSSILAFRWEALPTLRYFPNDIELALCKTLLEFYWILQVFCVRQEDGGGVASDIVKAESSGEDPRATGDLVSNLPHPRVNKTKQHTEMAKATYKCASFCQAHTQCSAALGT